MGEDSAYACKSSPEESISPHWILTRRAWKKYLPYDNVTDVDNRRVLEIYYRIMCKRLKWPHNDEE